MRYTKAIIFFFMLVGCVALQAKAAPYPSSEDTFELWEISEAAIINGQATMGYGHKLTDQELKTERISIDGKQVDYTKGLTDAQIEALFRQDMKVSVEATKRLFGEEGSLTQRQFDALGSLVYNYGAGNIRDKAPKTHGCLQRLSKDAALINDPKFELDLRMEWAEINKAKGEFIPGLLKRRLAALDNFFGRAARRGAG